MTYKNPKAFLDAAAALPAAIETKLPAGAPALSTRLLEIDNQLPALPDFPMEIPDLPAVTLPELPGLPEAPAQLGKTPKRYVDTVEVRQKMITEAGPGVAPYLKPPVPTASAPASSILQPASAQGARGAL